MRQARRWIAVLAVVMFVPALAGAANEGRVESRVRVAESGTFAIALERAGAWFERLTEVFTSMWGATRGTIVPGANAGGTDFGLAAPTTDLESGG